MTIPSIPLAATVAPSLGSATAPQSLAETLDMLTHAAEVELGLVTESPSAWGTAFYLGDGLQRAVTDRIFDLFKPQTWSPVNIWRLSSQTARQTMKLSTLLDPNQAALAWQELKNKLEVFTLVANLSSILKLTPGQFIPLPELVQKAYTLSPFAALWAVEGLGHHYTDTYLDQKGIPHGLLSEAEAQVPPESLLMLHAGMGLAFASRLLDTLEPDAPSASATHSVLQQFVSLCKDNARPGYLGAAIESLGLVTRDFFPELLDVVHEQFVEVAPELLGFFWHGAGRALYFSRQYFVPVLSTVWEGVDEEAHNCPDRESAMAGLAWAVTVVNMRQPAIMENVLRSQTQRSPLAHGFTNGMISTVVMRQDTTPGAPLISEFIQHHPPDPQMAAVWDTRVAAPCTVALQKYYPVLKEHHELDQVFRYQDLAALVEQLQRAGVAP